ncbi:hypothetical protein C8R43DRAFT_341339 [Mycena crocata]|nr:hypothetical protein C8R43DRAFT_341339 [Mycena crocata]
MHGLAQEVVDELIDWSHIVDANAMKPCGLVCKNWLRRSRYHLFATVLLSAANISSFIDLVEASSLPLLSFIRDLTLCYGGVPSDEAFLQKLYRTPNLKKIVIRIGIFVPDVQGALDWLNSAMRLHNHLRAWANSSSSLYTLVLEARPIRTIPLRTLVELISCLPTIKELSLLGLHHITADAGTPPAYPLELRLLHLNAVTGSEFLFSWLLSLPGVSRLQHLPSGSFTTTICRNHTSDAWVEDSQSLA